MQQPDPSTLLDRSTRTPVTSTPARRKTLMDAEIDAHLGCLQINPTDRDSLLALARFYLEPDLDAPRRATIRRAVAAHEDSRIAAEMLYWDLLEDGKDLEPEEKLRVGLALIAMTDGQPVPKDARRAITLFVSQAKDAGITARPHVEAIGAMASPEAAPLFSRRWRPDGGRFTRFVAQNVGLDVLLALGVVLAQTLPVNQRGSVTLLLLVVVGLAQVTLLLRYMRDS